MLSCFNYQTHTQPISMTRTRFWRRASYVELFFQVDKDSLSGVHSDSLTKSRNIPSPSSSLYSSSSASACLATDPMHGEKAKASSSLTCRSTAPGQRVGGVSLDALYIGDVIADDEGVKWTVRQCFCEVVECSGKTFIQLEEKEDMDVWDRGRPELAEDLNKADAGKTKMKWVN
jgi:hypothetical protein